MRRRRESAEMDGARPAEGAGVEKFSFILEALPSEVQAVVDTYNRMTVDWAVQYLAAFATLVLDKKNKQRPKSLPSASAPAAAAPQPSAPLQPLPAAAAVNAVGERDKDKDGKKGSKAAQAKKGGKDKDRPS